MKKTINPAMLLTLATALMSPLSLAAFKSRTVGGKFRGRRKSSSYWKPNGERECARRRRQIASGQLTESNGLWRGRRRVDRQLPEAA